MPVETWSAADFREQVAGWTAAQCERHQIRLTGGSEQPHCRPWSSAIRFESGEGPLWFKVNGPGTLHEGTLVGALSELEPRLVPEVLAVDVDRGWFLMRDAGPVMRSVLPATRLWPHWETVLVRYAEAQIRLADHVGSLIAAGVPEVSPATLPGQAADLVKELAELDPADGGLSPQEAEALRRRLPAYTEWCEALAASKIPSSIQHDDLHSSNICWGGSAERARIIDWGDASVGHPLGTMLCTLNSIGFHVGCELDDPRVQRVRDAYLEPYTTYADKAQLMEYVGLARRVGCVTRALSYRSAFVGEPVSTEAEYEFPVRGWLLEMLEDSRTEW